MEIKTIGHNTFQRYISDMLGNYNALEKLVQNKLKTFYCWLTLNVTKQQTCLGHI